MNEEDKKKFLVIAIIIVIVLIIIGIPVKIILGNISKNNDYNNKIINFKAQALKYAQDINLEGSTTITVSTLINNGYIKNDKTEEHHGEQIALIVNPIDKKENLACRLINIDKVDNNYNVDVTDKTNCDLLSDEIMKKRIGIRAFKYVNSTIGDELSIKNDTFEWTGTDVILVVNPNYDNITSTRITRNGTTLEVNKNTMLENPTKGLSINQTYSNVAVFTTENILKESVSVSVQTKTEIKNNTVKVQIDGEHPIIKTIIQDGTIKVYADDQKGTGIKGIIIGEDSTNSNNGKFYEINNDDYVEIDDGFFPTTYYVWAVDNVDNVSLIPKALTVQGNENTLPE